MAAGAAGGIARSKYLGPQAGQSALLGCLVDIVQQTSGTDVDEARRGRR